MAISDSKVNEFIEGIIELSKRFGFSLSHEDTNGAFVIEEYCSEDNFEWLRCATDNTNY